MFGSGQIFLNLSFYAILPVALIFYYVYKRDKFPEPPRVVLITFLLGIATTFPIGILIIAVEGFLSIEKDLAEKNRVIKNTNEIKYIFFTE